MSFGMSFSSLSLGFSLKKMGKKLCALRVFVVIKSQLSFNQNQFMRTMSRSMAFVMLVVFTAFVTSQKKTRVIFFGDSITQAGVNPNGYIRQMDTMLMQKGLDAQYELIGAGIGGNKIYDLYLRMDSDVVMKNPDVVFIYIGVNDVWHKNTSGTGTDAEKFERFYTTIIKKLQAKNIKLILCTPAVIGERHDYSNPQDGDLNYYSNMIRRLADTYNCKLVDLRSIFHDYDVKNNPENKDRGILTTDRVHLNPQGNKLVAESMLNVLLAK
jgi:isoamyl acetate esterase